MKFVILLALVVIAAAQQNRPDHDFGDPLQNLIHQEVTQIVRNQPNINVAQCAIQCDNLFDLNAGHDEEMVDRFCELECAHQINNQQGPGQGPGAGGN